MRIIAAVLSILTLASPAIAAPPDPGPERIEIPPELADPAMAEKLGKMVQALSNALLDMPVGEVQAVAEGRAPTAQDKALTVRDLGRRDDPDFDRDFQRHIAQAQPTIEHAMTALRQALPAMSKSLSEAAAELRRAVDNMPRPVESRVRR